MFHLPIYDARPSLLVTSIPLDTVGISACLCTSPYPSPFCKTREIILEAHYALLISTLTPIPTCVFLTHTQTTKSRATTSCTVASVSFPIPTPLYLQPDRSCHQLSKGNGATTNHTFLILLFQKTFLSLLTVSPIPLIATTPYFRGFTFVIIYIKWLIPPPPPYSSYYLFPS